MQWPNFWSSLSNDSSDQSKPETHSDDAEELNSTRQESVSNLEPTGPPLITSLTQPTTLLSTALLTTTLLTLYTLQRRFLRRIPTATAIPQTYILPSTRRLSRSLFGQVTSVGDADNFRLFHTPLGRLGLWGVLRKIPDDAKSLKNNTIHIRLAGIDAPELAHFGRPAQPYSKEALDWLTAYLRGRRVRCYVHKADQYSRVVATVYIRKGLLRRDVGLQMLKAGLATMYESKGGAEFSGTGVEEKYKAAEAWAKRKRKGMWRDKGKLETPREYKNRYRDVEGTKEA